MCNVHYTYNICCYRKQPESYDPCARCPALRGPSLATHTCMLASLLACVYRCIDMYRYIHTYIDLDR